MVIRKRKVNHRPDSDGVVPNHRALLDDAYREDRHLGLINNRGSKETPEHAWVRNSESAALHVLDSQVLRTRSLGEVSNRARYSQEILFIGTPNDRYDQAGFKCHSNADVHIPPIHDVCSVDGRVENWKRLDRFGGRAHEKRSVVQLKAVALLKFLSMQRPDSGQFRHLNFKHRGDMSRSPSTCHHMLGDPFAHG